MTLFLGRYIGLVKQAGQHLSHMTHLHPTPTAIYFNLRGVKSKYIIGIIYYIIPVPHHPTPTITQNNNYNVIYILKL